MACFLFLIVGEGCFFTNCDYPQIMESLFIHCTENQEVRCGEGRKKWQRVHVQSRVRVCLVGRTRWDRAVAQRWNGKSLTFFLWTWGPPKETYTPAWVRPKKKHGAAGVPEQNRCKGLSCQWQRLQTRQKCMNGVKEWISSKMHKM